MLCIIACVLSLAGMRLYAAGTPVDDLVTGNNTFAFDLYGRLKTDGGNLFFSPYSVSACLGMTYAGARGDTASQMSRTLHFSPDATQVANGFGALQKQLDFKQSTNGIALNIANGIWAEQSQPFEADFLRIVGEQYLAAIKQVDFHTQSEPVRKEINGWVSDKTRGKITDLLAPGVVNPSTRLVLVNAIYFKGRWVSPFRTSGTQTNFFFTKPDKSVPTPFMHQQTRFNYADVAGIQLVELPYNDADADVSENGHPLSMVILLPKEKGGLKKLESELNENALEQWLKKTGSQKVNLSLPKFKLTSQFSLGARLSQMGMPLPFTSGADFSGMDGARDLFISAIVHKAYVDVNEQGTEAAAATAAVMTRSAIIREKIVTFTADHPFIFLIRDNRSGSILFLGRVADPSK